MKYRYVSAYDPPPSVEKEVPVTLQSLPEGGIKIKIGRWVVAIIEPDGSLHRCSMISPGNIEGIQVDKNGRIILSD